MIEHYRDHSSSGHSHPAHEGSNIPILVAVLSLTVVVFLAEVIGAWWTGSLALATDAGHMLVDSAGLVIALIAAVLATKPRSDAYTWGLARVEVLSAAMQAGMLLVVCTVVTVEAIRRLFAPAEVLAAEMAIFGVIGLAANIIALFLLTRGRHQSLNMKAAFLEVLNDALGSVGVLVAAGIMYFTGWAYADSIASLLIASLMLPRALGMLVTSGKILLGRTPEGLDLGEVREHMLAIDHVVDVHDLHAETISTGNFALSAHVTVEDECFRSGHSLEILHQLQDCLATHFPISVEHCTFQLDDATHRDHELLEHNVPELGHSH